MMKRCLAMLLVMLLALGLAQAEGAEVAVTDAGADLPGGSIHYPQVTGLADTDAAAEINGAILAAGQIAARLDRAALLGSSPVKVNVHYDVSQDALAGGVLSCVFSAEGALADSRATHMYSAVNIDLASGGALTMADLFTDEAAARAALEEYLQENVAPELSAHLQNSSLTPLPETFGIDVAGITFYYPIEQLSTLSDRAGAVQLAWCELLEHLRLGEGTVLRRIGAEDMVTLGSRERIAQAAAAGALPGVPVKLGDSVQAATDAHRMLTDPDLYEDGRLFQLEDAAFRAVYLMTDRLTEGWDGSVVQGIRMDRGNLWGLCVGQTSQADWRQLLGEPDATVTLDADKADGQRLAAGESDYYEMAGHRLRLHADERGILVSLMLLE